jgi:hypothetical protein
MSLQVSTYRKKIEINLKKTFKGKEKDNLSKDFQRKRKGQFIERLSIEKRHRLWTKICVCFG